MSGDVDSEAAGTAVDDDEDVHTPSIDLELMAADETLEGDEDGRSVQSLPANDGGGVDWQSVLRQEPETTPTTTTTMTAADGRRLDDDDAVFGELVVRELRHITDPETKLILRHNILTAICETRLGCIQAVRSGGGHHAVQPPSSSLLRRIDQGDRRLSTLSTVNGSLTRSRRAHRARDDVDSAEAVFHRENLTVDGDGNIVIKEEME